MTVKGGPEGKEQCRPMALRLFPTCAEQFARKKDPGRAEAALLAYYVSNKFIYNCEVQSALLGSPARIDLQLPKGKKR